MRPLLTHIIGVPGAGKSTVMRAVIGEPLEESAVPVRHRRCPGGMEIGTPPSDTHGGGADGLRIDELGERSLFPWLRTVPSPLLYVEGGRLFKRSFFQAAAAAGYRVLVVHLDVPDDVAAARVAARTAGRRTPYRPQFVLGRRTAIENLTAHWPTVVVDATLPVEQVARQVSRAVFAAASQVTDERGVA
jgi:thymidylate kinase